MMTQSVSFLNDRIPTYLGELRVENKKNTAVDPIAVAFSKTFDLQHKPHSLAGKVKPLGEQIKKRPLAKGGEYTSEMGTKRKKFKESAPKIQSAQNFPSTGSREIEFKATHVDASQFQAAINCLEGMVLNHLAISKGSVNQEDYYLDHLGLKDSGDALYSNGKISKSFRIRKEESNSGGGQKHSMCVKVARKGDVETDHERQEYEIAIDDPKKSLEMLKMLGFSIEKIIKKIRTSFLYKTYEIALDEVVGFKKPSPEASTYEQEFSAYIVEVELKHGADEISDIPKCLEEMKQFVENSLGVTSYIQEQNGVEKYLRR
ncbi:MAG: CYTH domain-containing protein [Chlamydiota bacterium]